MKELPAPEKLRKIAAFVEKIGKLEEEFGLTLGLGAADQEDPVTIGPDHVFAVVRVQDRGLTVPGGIFLAVASD